jgi:hypothetical protein
VRIRNTASQLLLSFVFLIASGQSNRSD